MGIESVILAIKDTLEKNGLDRRVSIYGYESLNQPDNDVCVILRLSTGVHEVDAFGDNWVHSWQVIAEVYGVLDTTTAAHARIAQAVDKILTAIEKYPHLGKGASSDIRNALVTTISEVQPYQGEENTTTWLTASVTLLVEEEETTVALE